MSNRLYADHEAEKETPPVIHYGIRQIGVCGQRDAWRGKGRILKFGTDSDGKPHKRRVWPRSHYATSDTEKVTCPDCRTHAALTLLVESRRLLETACAEWRPRWRNAWGYEGNEVFPEPIKVKRR